MNSTEQQLKRIQEKLQLLLKEFHALRKENSRLKEELDRTGKRSKEQLKTVDDLKQQVSILKLGSAEMNDQDKKEFEKRINQYLKEIDRCIALLSE
jgi:hypothetical protein